MTRTAQTISFPILVAFVVSGLAWSCADDKDDLQNPIEGPTVICEHGIVELGPRCQNTYNRILDCCADEETARETATTLLCNMEADETACEQAGPSATDAACTQLSQLPECGQEGVGTDSDGGMDTDTEPDTNTPKSCQAKCTDDADCRKMNQDLGLICKNGNCVLGCRDSDACTPGRPECNLETHLCQCTATSCLVNQKCLASGVCGCANDDSCATLPATPECDTKAGECQCTIASCGENQKCQASRKCGCANDNYCNSIATGFVCNTMTGECECDDDSDCVANIVMDTCYRGVCGCSTSDVCQAQGAYDNAPWECESISS